MHLIAASVGFASLAALWLAVVWGIVLKNGWALTRIRHATLYGTHMTFTLFGLCLGVVHGLAQLAAPGGRVRVIDEWLPFANPHDRFGIGMGAIALELFAALILSVLLQRRLGYHRWRSMHRLAYLAYTLLVGHVLVSGSDVGKAHATALVLGSWLVTVGLWMATLPIVRRIPVATQERVSARLRGRHVTVNVDPARCARFGFCEHEAPEVFRLESDGRLRYRSPVPVDEIESAVLAARACPARAIILGRMPTTVITSSTGVHAVPDLTPDPTPGGAPDGASEVGSDSGSTPPTDLWEHRTSGGRHGHRRT